MCIYIYIYINVAMLAPQFLRQEDIRNRTEPFNFGTRRNRNWKRKRKRNRTEPRSVRKTQAELRRTGKTKFPNRTEPINFPKRIEPNRCSFLLRGASPASVSLLAPRRRKLLFVVCVFIVDLFMSFFAYLLDLKHILFSHKLYEEFTAAACISCWL